MCRVLLQICCFNGAEHVILLTDEGRLYSCGCNAYGQLGIDNVRRSSLLVLVEPLLHVRVVSVACSYHHSIAVTDQGEVRLQLARLRVSEGCGS